MRRATSSPRRYDRPTYIPIQPTPATSAPRTNNGKRTRKIPETKAGIVTDATNV